MNPKDRLAEDKAGQFRTTHWSVVLLSAQTQVPGSRTALADLCRLYWYPLYAFVRRRGYSAEDAQDLDAGFLSQPARTQIAATGRPGKREIPFVSFGLVEKLSFRRIRSREQRQAGQQEIEFVVLDFESGEERYRDDSADTLTAEKIYDARWAMTLLDHAIGRLHQEYAAQGKTATIDALQPFLDSTNCKRLPSYEEVADQLQVSLSGVKTLIHRLRKRYSELLREEVARTVTDPQAVDDEIHSLCEALISSEGRLGP